MKVIALGSGNCLLAGPKLLFGGHSSKSLQYVLYAHAQCSISNDNAIANYLIATCIEIYVWYIVFSIRDFLCSFSHIWYTYKFSF